MSLQKILKACAFAVAIALGSVVLPLRSVASSIASGLGMPAFAEPLSPAGEARR